MAQGALGYIGIAKQNSFGTAVSSFVYIEPISESFTTDVEQLILEGLQNGFQENITVEGLETTEGDFTMNMDPLKTGNVLDAVFGQVATTLTTSTGAFAEYTHEFIPKPSDFDQFSALTPHTLQVFRDTGESYQYTDASFPSLSIEVEAGAVPTMTINGLTRTASLMTATGPSFESGTPFAWNVASISIGDVGITDFESISINFDQSVEGVALLNGTKRNGLYLRSGLQMPRMSGTLNFASNSEYIRFKGQGEARMLITLGSMINSGPTMTIDLPALRYTSYAANLGGPGRISADVEGQGKYSVNSSYAVRVTLSNTQISY